MVRRRLPLGGYLTRIFSYFAALGYEITVEESSSHGRLDTAVRAGGRVYLFDAGRPVVRHASTAVRRRAGWANGHQRRSTPGTVAGDDVDRRCDWWSRLVGA